MKGIELVSFLTDDQKKLLEVSEINYKRYGRIYISIVSFNGNILVVKISQKENEAQKYLRAKELRERAKEVFKGIIPDNIKLHIGVVPYTQDSLSEISIEWIKEQQNTYGISDAELAKFVNIDQANLFRIFNQRGLTKIHKALFYYFFKYFALSNQK